MAFGVARTGIFLGVDDSGGDTALSGFGVCLGAGGSAGAVILSLSFVIDGISSFSEMALEPLTRRSGEGFFSSFALSSCGGVAFVSSSFSGTSGSGDLGRSFGTSTACGASFLTISSGVGSNGEALTNGATFCCNEEKFEAVPTEIKLDFTRGFPAAPFPFALSFFSVVVFPAPLPCCSKKARNEETCASLTTKWDELLVWLSRDLEDPLESAGTLKEVDNRVL